jgi:6-phosphofructokinase
MHNLLVAQSGGPTSAINATLSGVITEAMIQGGIDRIYGGLNGIEGILQEKIIDLLDHINNTMDLDKLAQTPGFLPLQAGRAGRGYCPVPGSD